MFPSRSCKERSAANETNIKFRRRRLRSTLDSTACIRCRTHNREAERNIKERKRKQTRNAQGNNLKQLGSKAPNAKTANVKHRNKQKSERSLSGGFCPRYFLRAFHAATHVVQYTRTRNPPQTNKQKRNSRGKSSWEGEQIRR